MFESDTIAGGHAHHIPEDEGLRRRDSVPALHECRNRIASFSWVFMGKHAMPRAEHLIPFRT